ncbi:MAG: tetratricopeptide repeat protein [Bacteroidia bacterium]|nr:tetratricopeptide repeat protein [Bacteroidia bacterium]
MADILNNMAGMYQNERNYTRALDLFGRSVEIYEKLQDTYSLAVSYTNIGTIHLSLGDQVKALDYYEKALALNQQLGAKAKVADVFMNIGVLYFTVGNYPEAEENLKKALQMADQLDYKELQSEIYLHLSNLFAARKDGIAALAYYKSYHSLLNAIYSEETKRKIAEIRTKYESEKKDQENKLLRKENELKESEIARYLLQQRQSRLEAERQIQKNLLLESEKQAQSRYHQPPTPKRKKIYCGTKNKRG